MSVPDGQAEEKMDEKMDETGRGQARHYGVVRVGRVRAEDRAIILLPETWDSPLDAERYVRQGETGEWAVIRLVRTLAVGRETIVRVIVGKGPEL